MQNQLIKSGQYLNQNDLNRIKSIIEQATATNTRRAYGSDLSYLDRYIGTPYLVETYI
jgi:hypothetical protein